MSFQGDIGLLAGVIGFLAFVPYIYDIVKGKTRPSKAGWIIWAVLGIVIAASYYSAGAHESAFVPAAYALGILAVAGLSLKYGKEGWTRLDLVCLAGAGLGIALWAATGDPASALFLTTAVDMIGAVPTIVKTYHEPKSESLVAWILFAMADIANFFAIKEWSLASASYPVYVFILALVMNALILRPRKR
ncbi:MAG: hypothetical protein V1827_03130 [Candidatus Micrarchaeota archaeon]